MNSFFDPSGGSTKRSLPLLPACGECGLFKTCKSQKMKPTGRGKRKILIVGEAPGETEDKRGIQFVGKTGRLLRSTIQQFGIHPDRDCIWTNAIICRPPGNKIPSENTVDYCRPNLLRTIEEVSPEVILLLGGAAVESLIGWLWKEGTGGIGRWMGFRIPVQRINAWVCPMWHPSYVSREMEAKHEVVPLIWRKHLKAALKLRGHPHINAPRFEEKVQTILDTSRAAKAILERFSDGRRPIAFDYETDRLKPDHPDSRIVSCALSDGLVSIAYPWHGDAIKATVKILQGPRPKIGWNMKFEERWSLRHFGPIKNWKFDGQLACHITDNRKYITALKFQAFSVLGQEDWSEEVKPYLEGEGGNGRNRIHQCDITKVCQYNGMDSLIEWHLGKHYMKKVGKWKTKWDEH